MNLAPERTPLLVLGIMSGTSLDGIDYALCRVSRGDIRLCEHWNVGFPRGLRGRLDAAARGVASSWELARLHHDLGRLYARGALGGLGRRRPAVVGLHGQTVYHAPPPGAAATLQIGEPAWLVEALRVPVVANFRAADLAAGGQGAPLATLLHREVFGRPRGFVCVNNLGGISNVTALDARHTRTPRVLAFDTGPANVLLDLAARELSHGRRACDRDGRWAARGRVFEPLLARWLRHPYFEQAPPKSTGREQFGEPFWRREAPRFAAAGLSKHDVLATLTEFTARSLALNYRRHLPGLPSRVILTGGGAANPVLVERIRVALTTLEAGLEVTTSDALGWPLQAIEPAAFALLAAYRLWGLPGNLPSTTGASRAVLLGQVAEP